MDSSAEIRSLIQVFEDFPRAGVRFLDISPLLQNSGALNRLTRRWLDDLHSSGIEFDVIAAIEARGFVFGTVLAYSSGSPFIMIRKQGKLPGALTSKSIQLEYGDAILEMQSDAIQRVRASTGNKNPRVLLVDDIVSSLLGHYCAFLSNIFSKKLATGGTLNGACELIEEMGGTIAACTVLIQLTALNGHINLKRRTLHSILNL